MKKLFKFIFSLFLIFLVCQCEELSQDGNKNFSLRKFPPNLNLSIPFHSFSVDFKLLKIKKFHIDEQNISSVSHSMGQLSAWYEDSDHFALFKVSFCYSQKFLYLGRFKNKNNESYRILPKNFSWPWGPAHYLDIDGVPHQFFKLNSTVPPFPLLIHLILKINSSFHISLKLEWKTGKAGDLQTESQNKKGNLIINKDAGSDPSAQYEDKEKDAFFIVLFGKGKENNKTFIGSFMFEGENFDLIPKSFNSSEVGGEVEDGKEILVEKKFYQLIKIKKQKNISFGNDEPNPESNPGISYEDVRNGKLDNNNSFPTTSSFPPLIPSTQSSILSTTPLSTSFSNNFPLPLSISNQRKTKQLLTVELFLIFDISSYNKWLLFSKNNENTATSHMKYYFSHIIMAVSSRYEGIKSEDFNLKMVAVAFYIAKSKDQCPFTENNRVKVDQKTIRPANVLDEMDYWLRWKLTIQRGQGQGQIKWPTFDLVALYTEYETPGILGMAHLKTVCISKSVSVIHNSGSHVTIYVSAHEFGHAMGMRHDGEGNNCPPGKQFIMAPNTYQNSKNPNEEKFSSCSIHSIRNHIRDLNRWNKNCLLNTPQKEEGTKGLPGQRFSLDDQCKMNYGTQSYFCRTNRGFSCSHLECFYPPWKTCLKSETLRVQDGSSCGFKKWCIKGQCVYDQEAPAVEEKKCMFGDFKGNLPHKKLKDLTCHDLKTTKRFLCYDQMFQEMCCQTCSTSARECSYGDMIPYCHSSLCEFREFKDKCCKTCKNPREDQRCPQQDLKSCFRGFVDCYKPHKRQECCNACQQKFKNFKHIKNCTYGDKLPWCLNEIRNRRQLCKNSNEKTHCCASCNKI